MERAVFYIAIVVAGFIALGSLIGSDQNFRFSFAGDHDFGDDPVVAVAPGQSLAAIYAASEIEIEHAAIRLVVVPEDRDDIEVTIDNPGHLPMPTMSVEGSAVQVDGHLRGRVAGCRDDGAEIRGYGQFTNADLPLVTIHAPRDVVVSIDGAGTAEIGTANSVEADISGCGKTTVADVAGTLRLDISGDSSVTAGAVQSLDLDLSGSGEVQTGAVRESAEISIAGSGSAVLASLNGSLDAEAAGSGRVEVNGGALTTVNVDVAGSGDLSINAPVERLAADMAGSGSVTVRGTVGEVEADIAGSGQIRVQAVTGTIRKEVWGSGDVTVGPI